MRSLFFGLVAVFVLLSSIPGCCDQTAEAVPKYRVILYTPQGVQQWDTCTYGSYQATAWFQADGKYTEICGTFTITEL